jgi:hypothetical protein
MIDSERVRSILPFINARNVNSPRRLSLNPAARRLAITPFTAALPPWQEISAQSSPVKDFGARNTETRTWSILSGVLTVCIEEGADWSADGEGFESIQPNTMEFPGAERSFWEGENTDANNRRQSFPDVLTTASAFSPQPVARAAMGESSP